MVRDVGGWGGMSPGKGADNRDGWGGGARKEIPKPATAPTQKPAEKSAPPTDPSKKDEMRGWDTAVLKD